MKKQLLLLFLFLPYVMQAQLFCSGTVVDSLTNEPLEGASILLNYQGKNTGTKTGADGKFYVELPYSENALQIRYNGYVPRWIILPPGKSFIDGVVRLEQVTNTLEQVVVSSKGFDQNIRKPVLGANSINIKTLEKIPSAFGEIDLFRSIQMLPGVTSVGEASNGVNIRGGTTDQNLILIDDMPVFNPTHMFGLFSVTPPDALRNLDLYKGNVPARYGGRVASVMDIALKNPDLTKFTMSGGLSLISEKLMINAPVVKDKLGVYLAGRGSFHDAVLPYLDKNLESIRARFGEGVAKAFWRINRKNTFISSTYLNTDFFQTDLLTNLPNVVGTTTFFEHNTVNSMARWAYVINDKLDIQTTAMIADYRPSIATNEAETNNTIRLESAVRQRQLKSSAYYQSARHKSEGGIVYTNYQINPGTLQPGNSESVNLIQTQQEQANEWALFADDEFSLNSRLALITGLRFSYFQNLGPSTVRTYLEDQPRDEFSVKEEINYRPGEAIATYGGLEPRFGLLYRLDQQSSLKMGYNLMRQYLQIVSNTTTPIPTSRWKTSDHHIRPQISHLITAGYYKNFPGGVYELTVEGYYRHTDNIIDYKPGADFLLQEYPETQLVQGISKAYGLELMVSKSKGSFTGWSNYTYSRTFNKVYPETNILDLVNGGDWYAANYDRPHSFNTSVDFRVDEHNSFSFNFVYSTGRPYTEPVGFVTYLNSLYPFYDQRNNKRIPDYHRLDMSWNISNPSLKTKRWQGNWAFSVYNLYARKNVYSVFFKTENNLTRAYKLSIFRIPIVSLAYNFRFE